MQFEFFGSADHAEALQLTDFEIATAEQLAFEVNKSQPGASEFRKAKESVKRWNNQRQKNGLPVII